jgi:hypothetical protein
MIPLSHTKTVKKFPWPSLCLILLYIAAEIFSRLGSKSHENFLLDRAFIPALWNLPSFGFLFHHHFFSLLFNILYIWVFTPRLFEQRNYFLCLIVAFVGVQISYASFALIHPHTEEALLNAECFTSVLLGLSARQSIWESINTLVPGFFWLRIYEVPAYVLLFFFLFYVFLGQLFAPPPFDQVEMPYLLSLIGFLWGFAFSKKSDLA